MVKKIRFQELRSGHRRRGRPRGAWMLEPTDLALIGAALVAALWLQWISVAS